MTTILDGKELAAIFQARVAREVGALRESDSLVPGLAVVLCGDDPASQVYVRSKERACREAGMHAVSVIRDNSVTTADVIAIVEELNRRDDVHGILVQLPLPRGCDEPAVLRTVAPHKDVDGFHPYNLGNLLRHETPSPPCTPRGILEALRHFGVPMSGANAVVIGRSVIVGKPMAMLLLHQNATVTMCHSRTRNLPEICREADILVAAVGQPFMVRGDWIKDGAVVIDVGVNRVGPELLSPEAIASNPAHAPSLKKRGYALVGDVAYHEALGKASLLTPVPGGVGPLTIAMLMRNTVNLAKLARGIPLE